MEESRTLDRLVTAEDIYELLQIDEVAVAPVGHRVAFSLTLPVRELDGYRTEIWVVDGKRQVRPWATMGLRSYCPRWSPDGRWLGFLSNRNGSEGQLWLSSTDGGDAVAISTGGIALQDFQWSPDGRWVVAVAEESSSPKGQNQDFLLIDSLNYKLNGKGYLDKRRQHLLLISIAGGSTEWLTGGEWDDVEPRWSPDGRWIAFVSARHASRDIDFARDIFLLDWRSGEIRLLTQTAGHVRSIAWSPDGRWLAYAGTSQATHLPAHHRLYLISVAGGTPRLISGGWDRNVVGPVAWTPDGGYVLATFEDRGRRTLAAVNPHTGEICPLGRQSWQVTTFAVGSNPGQGIAMVASHPLFPPEVYHVKGVGATEMSLLTALHDDWRTRHDLMDLVPFQANAEDGAEVDAWLLPPRSTPQRACYPVLLDIHGGPYAQYGYGFSQEFQFWSARGYAVLFGNPRGSSGYDEGWAQSVGLRRGVVDYGDIMAMVDEGLRRWEWLDPGRMVVHGHSYGGYMTLWILTRSTRFRAACAEAAPVNLYSMSGTSDQAGKNRRLQYGFTAQENPQYYYEKSPISYVDRITTPLLLIHGACDLRVPLSQAEELFVALKLLGRTVELAVFPGEHHGLNKSGRPSHRVARLHLIERFFARYVG